MVDTSLFPPAVLRVTSAALAMIQKVLMVSGLVLMIVLAGLHSGHTAIVEGLRSVLPARVLPDAAVPVAVVEAVPEAVSEVLSPSMRGALEYVSRRYRVSVDALQPIFATAQVAGRELRLDPLLIIAVIGVESGFNPFSQSVFGAQGLMQVVPRFHLDKLPTTTTASFLDPVINVRVGARVLNQSIRSGGGLEDGLQQFGGALNDPERRYSSKVLAERQRLEQATTQRPRSPAGPVVVSGDAATG